MSIHLINTQFKSHQKEFWALWWKGYQRHPKTYLDAFLNLSVSYWYPYPTADFAYIQSYYNLMYWGDTKWFGEVDEVHDLNWQMNQGDTRPIVTRQLYHLLYEIPNYPVIAITYRPGLYTLGFLLLGLIALLKRNKQMYPLLLLVLAIILTCIYSPIVNYFRYSYVFISIIPLLIPLLWIDSSKNP